MADDKKKDADLGEHTVHVTVEPQDGKTREERNANRESAGAIKDHIKEKVKEEIKKREGQGSRKQLDVVDDAAEEAKRRTSPRTVKHVEIKIDGETNDGDVVTRRRRVTPKE